jgi:DNA-binding response OmpR family regulator
VSSPPHIVLVDDEEDLRDPLVDYLREEGLEVSGVDGGAALDRLMAERPVAVAVLDVNMPGEDGFSIARRLRAADPRLGIVMLTSKRDLVDRIVGLEIGADDYLTKPLDPRELLARLRAMLRRLGDVGERPATAAGHPGGATTHTDAQGGYIEAIWVQSRHGGVRVAVSAIERIEAAKDYVLLHTPGRSHMLRTTMGALERQLDPAQLIRVHRSTFVRPEAVVEVRRSPKGAVSVVLRSGAEAPVGSNYLPGLEARLAERSPAATDR